jgi:hypothetical protein
MVCFSYSLLSLVLFSNVVYSNTAVRHLNPIFTCPTLKMIPWTSLTEEQRAAAVILHYNQTTWQQTMGNPIEHTPYRALMENEKVAAQFLGYVDDCWNCDIGKYNGCWWSEIVAAGKEAAWNALGFNRQNWELGHDYPKTWTGGLTWAQLTESERWGAQQVCYDQNSWDNYIG